MAIKADISVLSGLDWNGYSETLKNYFVKNEIDPKTKYRRFYSNKRHTAAGSYTWLGTNLYKFADKADESRNAGKSLFIDVLVVTQFGSKLTSDQVIETTDECYENCEVWVCLDDSYFDRAWCLAEAAKFQDRESNCVLTVSGSANFKPGTNFFRGMKAGNSEDIPLIKEYVLQKYKSEENFNAAVEEAIVRLSPWSLFYQGRYREAFQACEKEIVALARLPADNSKNILEAKGTMAVCCERLGDLQISLALHQQVLEGQVRCYGTGHASVAGTYVNMGTCLVKMARYEDARDVYQKSLNINQKCLGEDHTSTANSKMGASRCTQQPWRACKSAEIV